MAEPLSHNHERRLAALEQSPPLTAEQRLECLRLAIGVYGAPDARSNGPWGPEGIVNAARQFEAYVRGEPGDGAA